MYKSLLFSLFFVITIGSLTAQSKINLMSGKSIEGTNIKIDEDFIHYDFTIKDKIENNQIEIYRVFSITDESGKEQIVYEQDSLHGRYYNLAEMQNFIKGEQDADKSYKSPATTIVTGVLGVANGLVFSKAPILALPGAFVTAFIASAMPSKPKAENASDKEALKKPEYHDGYKRVAKSKKLRNGMVGSIVGTAIGLVTGQFVTF